MSDFFFSLLALLAVGVVISYLTSQFRRQPKLPGNATADAALYSLGRDLAVANDLEAYLQAILRRVGIPLKTRLLFPS